MAHEDECGNLEGFTLEFLPVDVLHVIFGYLDVRSLFALSSASRILNSIIKDEYLNIASSKLLVTNQVSPQIKNKSLKILPGVLKFKNRFHWQKKQYNQHVYLKTVEKFRPWIQLRSKELFVTQGSKILFFKRNKTGIVQKPCIVFRGHKEDVIRFVTRDNLMISGGNDGKICCWDINNKKTLYSVSNPIGWSESLYVDFKQTTVAAGFSLRNDLDFWLITDNGFTFCKRIKLVERLRSISLSEDSAFCAFGSCGYRYFPLKIFDINRETYLDLSGDFKKGAGIFAIVWESPQTLLTGGFDSMLHLWDIRLGRPVKSWSDPFDVAIYSLASDYNCTVMSGSALHSRITLWDKRQSNWIQLYYMSKAKFAGPVYSFDFDPSYMFAALDTSLHILDFGGLISKSNSFNQIV